MINQFYTKEVVETKKPVRWYPNNTPWYGVFFKDQLLSIQFSLTDAEIIRTRYGHNYYTVKPIYYDQEGS